MVRVWKKTIKGGEKRGQAGGRLKMERGSDTISGGDDYREA